MFCFSYRLLLTDTAAKLQAVKDKARQANDTAKDVLAQIKDLHQNLDGLKKNYNQLADSVAKTNAVVKDPSKNSKISFITLIVAFISSHSKSILDSAARAGRSPQSDAVCPPPFVDWPQELNAYGSRTGIQDSQLLT